MKKIISLFGIVLLLVLIFAIPGFTQGPPGNWTTDFTILNLSGDPGTLQITRYGECTGGCSADSGTSIASISLPGNGSYYYNPINDTNFPSGAGSVILSSSKPIAAIATAANGQSGSAYASDAYAAVSQTSSTVFLPIIMGNLGVWNTRIAVQNAGTAPTDVTITYIGSGAPSATTISNLPPGMVALVDQQENSGMNNFNGSAQVTTTGEPVAVLVDEYKSTGGVLVSYVGVPSTEADTTIYMPGFIAQGTWATDFTIVNTGSASTDITVSFSGSSNSITGTLAANSSAYINGFANVYPSGWSGSAPTSGYYGSATVTSSSQDVVVVYNISNSAGGPGNFALGYVGYPSTAGATLVAIPLIENHYSAGWDTTFSVQNIEGGTAELYLTYSGNQSANCSPCTYSMTTESHTFNQAIDGHIPAGFIGGVTITSTKKIVVVGDQNLTGGIGDTAAGFPGIKIQ